MDVPTWQPEHPLVGRVLQGRFQVASFVCEGGMAQVFCGAQEEAPHHLAIKVMHPDLADDPEIIQRFFREARIAQQLRHPNIVEIVGMGEDDGLLFIVMELLFGDDLSARIKQQGSFSHARAVEIMADVFSALQYAHERGIVHRDIKPENVMLCRNPAAPDREVVKVLDFGIAKILDRTKAFPLPDFAPSGQRSVLTRVGELVGTPGYMSPEQGNAEPLDARSDIYSAGCMLYELLTGRLPFEGETALQVLMRHVQEPPPPPSQFGPIHPELERLVLRTLAKKPADRPSTARDVADELLLLLGDIEAHSVERWQRFSTAPTSPPPPPPRESVPPTANPAPIDEAGLQPSATPGDLPSERAYTEPVEAPPRLDTNIPRPPRPAPRRGTQRLAHPFVGKVLAGRFEVRSLVREGSVSQIFTGVSEQEPRHVAIKVLNPEHASEDEVAQRFVRAGEAASHFRHPNIVRTHLAAVEEGLPFVVMELLFGDDLSGRIRQRGSLSQDAAVHIAVQTCKALAHAHQLGIVHRDLKPENLMLCRQPSDPSREIVKVIDFGTAKIFDENSKLIPPGGARGRQIVTRVGALIGSPAYISPEQARSGPTDARSDIYSLGVVLYELLTGRTPFAGQRPIELVAQHLNDAPPPPSTFAPVPRELERIVLRCLEKSPDDRPQSAIELAAHLETALYDIAKAAVSERMMRWRRRVSPLPAELMPVALAAISASSPTIAAVSEASVPPTQLAAGHLEPTASPATEQPAQRSASTSSPPVDPEALAPESHAPRLDASARALATTVLAPASARPHSVPPAPLSTAPASLTSGAASALPPPQSFPPQSLPPQSLPPQSLPPRVSEEAAHDRSSSLASRDAADIARLSRLVTVLGAVLAVTLVALGVVVFLLLRR